MTRRREQGSGGGDAVHHPASGGRKRYEEAAGLWMMDRVHVRRRSCDLFFPELVCARVTRMCTRVRIRVSCPRPRRPAGYFMESGNSTSVPLYRCVMCQVSLKLENDVVIFSVIGFTTSYGLVCVAMRISDTKKKMAVICVDGCHSIRYGLN